MAPGARKFYAFSDGLAIKNKKINEQTLSWSHSPIGVDLELGIGIDLEMLGKLAALNGVLHKF